MVFPRSQHDSSDLDMESRGHLINDWVQPASQQHPLAHVLTHLSGQNSREWCYPDLFTSQIGLRKIRRHNCFTPIILKATRPLSWEALRFLAFGSANCD